MPGEEELINNSPLDLIFPTVTENTNTTEGVYFMTRAFMEDVDIPTKASCTLAIMGRSTNKSHPIILRKTVLLSLYICLPLLALAQSDFELVKERVVLEILKSKIDDNHLKNIVNMSVAFNTKTSVAVFLLMGVTGSRSAELQQEQVWLLETKPNLNKSWK